MTKLSSNKTTFVQLLAWLALFTSIAAGETLRNGSTQKLRGLKPVEAQKEPIDLCPLHCDGFIDDCVVEGNFLFTTDSFNNKNSACLFNGAAKVGFMISASPSFTVAFKIKIVEVTEGPSYLLGSVSAGGNGWAIEHLSESSFVFVEYRDGKQQSVSDSFQLTSGVWHDVGVVKNGKTCTINVDGSVNRYSSLVSVFEDGMLTVGAQGVKGGKSCEFAVDELFYEPKAWSNLEVKQYFDAFEAAFETTKRRMQATDDCHCEDKTLTVNIGGNDQVFSCSATETLLFCDTCVYPTALPTESPSFTPSIKPTALPTVIPTAIPTVVPSVVPTEVPSEIPSVIPSEVPSTVPTELPSVIPTELPSEKPSESPSYQPSQLPSILPSWTPSFLPTTVPTGVPTAVPTIVPTALPTTVPTIAPTAVPTVAPTAMAVFSHYNNQGTSQGIAIDEAANTMYFTCGSLSVCKTAVSPQSVSTYLTVTGNGPFQLALHPTTKQLYVVLLYQCQILKVTAANTYTVVAGTIPAGTPTGDGGQASSAKLVQPYSVFIDTVGAMFITSADGKGHVRKVSPSGIITTVAGPGTTGVLGDNGPATSASMWSLYNVACDTTGVMYLQDWGNGRVRKVDTNGILTTFIGRGTTTVNTPYVLGVAYTSAMIYNPNAMVFAQDGFTPKYLTSKFSYMMKLENGIVSRYAGTGVASSTGDGGPPSSATLNVPLGLYYATTNDLYINENGAIRQLSNA